MSTIDDRKVAAEPVPGSPEDPFRYGWRYVIRRGANGRLGRNQVPLTLRDLLFPLEGDFAMQEQAHVEDCFYLMGAFQSRTAGDPRARVLSDCRVRWDVPGLEPLGPDVAVFFEVPEDWEGGTLDVAATGARPVLVVEITSPDTRVNDFGVKKEYYHQAGVPTYVIVDVRYRAKRRKLKILGFRRSPDGYEPIPLDQGDRLWLEPFQLWMAIADRRVACIDGTTGRALPGPGEAILQFYEGEANLAAAQAELAEAEAARLQAEAERVQAQADLAEAEAARLQAEAERVQAQADLAEAEAERTRAQAREDAQTLALDDASARILAMEAELRKLRGES